MFEQDADSYFDRAVAAVEDGRFYTALHYARRAARLDSYSIDAMMLIAEIYTEMGLYYQAINQYFKVLTFEEEASECYIAIGQNFYMLDQNLTALKFIKRGIAGAWDQESLQQAKAVLESVGGENKFRVISGSRNNELVISMAQSLIGDGEYDGAIKLLNFVPEDSAQYPSAALHKAVCLRSLGDYDGSLKLTEEQLKENPDDISLLCNLVKIYIETKRTADADGLLEELKTLTAAGRDDSYAIAVALLCGDKPADAVKFLERYLESDPYEANVLTILGQAYHNIGELDKAQECFLAILAVDDDNIVAKFYNKYIQEARIRKKPALKYIFQLPLKEVNKTIARLAKTAGLSDGGFRDAVLKKGFFEELMWLYGIGRQELYELINGRLAGVSDRRADDFLRSALVDLRVSNLVKKSIFAAMLKTGKTKRLAVTVGEDIKFLTVTRPKSLISAPDHVIGAYSAVFSALAFIAEGFEKKLNAAVNKLNKTFAKHPSLTSVPELACMLAYITEGGYLGNLDGIIKIFSADGNAVREYFKIAKIETLFTEN